MIINILFTIFLGLAGGLAVGAGLVAFLTVLGIIPRLTQLTKTHTSVRAYEWSVILGAIFGGWTSLHEVRLNILTIFVTPIGLLCGLFVGMVAAALTEVLNVLPIIAKRIGVDGKITLLIMALVFGKIIGSLYQWVIYVNL